MGLKEQLKEASILIMSNQVKKISDGGNFGEMWEVNDEKKHIIRLMKKSNLSFFKCDCAYCSIHPQVNPICKNKLAVILFEMQNVWK